jgi:hypothetical protein
VASRRVPLKQHQDTTDSRPFLLPKRGVFTCARCAAKLIEKLPALDSNAWPEHCGQPALLDEPLALDHPTFYLDVDEDSNDSALRLWRIVRAMPESLRGAMLANALEEAEDDPWGSAWSAAVIERAIHGIELPEVDGREATWTGDDDLYEDAA